MMKKLLIHIRTSLKFVSLVAISIVLIVAAIIFIYQPMYSVTLNGEFIGYTENKSALQDRINQYIKLGDGEHIAFVQIDTLPEYKLCLLKKDNKSNDEEIFEKVKSMGIAYYKYYAITESAVEKLYVSSQEEAQKAIDELKEKNSSNKENLAYVEKYSTNLVELVDTQTAVSKLYVKPIVVNTMKYASTGYANTSQTVNTGKKISIGVNLIRPVSGTITSRFGSRGRGTHTGLDIAASRGTPIKAAAAGTVTYSGTKGSYGNLVIITHADGTQTYYAHCNTLNVTAGQKVSQGQLIATVGSTGNSTGPHLHLEIRVNGVAQNPQNYLY